MIKDIWESLLEYRARLKKQKEKLKKYLRGKALEGTRSHYSGPIHGRKKPHKTSWQQKNRGRALRRRRKIRNKIAYRSRLANQ